MKWLLFLGAMICLSVLGLAYRISIGGELVGPVCLIGLCIAFAVKEWEDRA